MGLRDRGFGGKRWLWGWTGGEVVRRIAGGIRGCGGGGVRLGCRGVSGEVVEGGGREGTVDAGFFGDVAALAVDWVVCHYGVHARVGSCCSKCRRG